LYQEAERLFLAGKIEAAIALLDDDKLRQAAEQAQKALNDAIQGWRLKANLFQLKFRFEHAEKAYETALGYINRESNPQLWAETEVDLGNTHDELGIRVEGKAVNEHLTAAVVAFRSALEVYTRKELPQDWAITQYNLPGPRAPAPGGSDRGDKKRRASGPGSDRLPKRVGSFFS
jgi:tetratricopeptide (TPR) repeat protein